MIDLALDPSDTRPARGAAPAPARTGRLRVVALALVGATALGGFGVAASTLMAGLAAPAPVKRASQVRAADWPDLKDGLPSLTGAEATTPTPAVKRAEPEAPALRMAALPEAVTAFPTPAATPVRPAAVAVRQTEPAPAPEPAVKRIPVATPVAPIGPARQATTIAPARTAALQPPSSSETVRARTLAEPAAAPAPPAVLAPRAVAPPVAASEKPEKPARKVAVTRKPVPAAATPGAVAEAAPEPEETEVLGIKLPSLAPAGRKLKEGVDALGDAVRSVF